jgi:ribosomal protein L11 methyltransferase
VAARIEAVLPDELFDESTRQARFAPAEIVLANILALPLIELAPQLQALCAAGGHLVLSGILTEQADAVAAAYVPWFEMKPAVRREDWVRLHGRHR